MPAEVRWLARELVAPRGDTGPVRGLSAARAARRVAVHQNTFVVSLADALVDTFPVTHALCGDAFFRAMAAERVRTDPPASPVLLDYADGFAAYIARFAPAASVPYLADVARLEAARVASYHAHDAATVDATAFAELLRRPDGGVGARLSLHPAARVLRFPRAAFSLWRAHVAAPSMDAACLDDIDVDVGEDVLVSRPDLDVSVSALPPGAHAFLSALSEGHALGAAVDAAHRDAPDAEVQALLYLLIEHRLVTRIHTVPETAR